MTAPEGWEQPQAGSPSSRISAWTNNLNQTKMVHSFGGLMSVLKSDFEGTIQLADDIVSTRRIDGSDSISDTPTPYDVRGRDLIFDLNGYTIRRAGGYSVNPGDGDNPYHINLEDSTGDSVVVWRDGAIDGNRRNQDGSYSGQGWHELQVKGAKKLVTRNLELYEHLGWGFFSQDVDYVNHINPYIRVQGGDLAADADYAGLDGIHSSGSIRTTVVGADIIAGDDGVAVFTSTTGLSRDVESVYITGSVKSPWHANGVRIEIEDGTGVGPTIQNARVDAEIGECGGSNVKIENNDNDNSRAIGSVSLSGTYDGSNGEAGVDLRTDINEFYSDATVIASSSKGYWVRNTVTGDVVVDGVVRDSSGQGVFVRGGDAPEIRAKIVGSAQPQVDTQVRGTVISGTIVDGGSAGVYGSDVEDVRVDAHFVNNSGAAVDSAGTSNYWRGQATGYGNGGAANLSGSNNTLTSNFR